MTTLPVPNTNLTVRDYDIYGKHGIRKPGKRDCYHYSYTDGSRGYANRWKLVWCAEHDTDPRKVGKEYSFRLLNGVVICEEFGKRMSEAYDERRKQARLKWEDYDFIERFAHECKELLNGGCDARGRIFSMLNGKRDELIRYAMHAAGGVGKQRATDYADITIMQVFDAVIDGRYHVPSPVASMKFRIRKMIIDNRRKREWKEK